jgi:SAM-dependent methyltransferase
MTDIASHPAPWCSYTTPEFWADEHISAQMLAAHLNPDWEAASRNHATVDRAVTWLVNTLRIQSGTRVLDLGCGPGLYATRLAQTGAGVTGLDISPRSIAYARQLTADAGQQCQFRVANYLIDDLGGPYDVALFSYEDVNVLSPDQRATLFARIAAALGPGGVLAMDVTAAARFDLEAEGRREGDDLDNGFWAPSPYHGVVDTFKYDDERLLLERYVITKGGQARVFWNWTQCLTPEQVRAELAAAGFGAIDLVGDLTGAPFSEESPVFAVLARR